MSATRFDTVRSLLVCDGCRVTQQLQFPIALAELGAALEAFDEAHGKCEATGSIEDTLKTMTPDEWLFSGDAGISSMTIFAALTGREYILAPFGPGVPVDPSDFGRCHRLLKRFPEWRDRLPEVSEKYPEWAGLVRDWDQLTALYREELPSGIAPRLYERLQTLRR